MPEPPIRTTARIVTAIGRRAFRATLPNGKPVVAHLPARNAVLADALRPGNSVIVALSPYDFDHARIESLAPENPGHSQNPGSRT